jgi:serine/threonine-protein kinase CTR1
MPDGNPFLVSELMDQGSLWTVLRRVALDWSTRIQFACDIASGMVQVHELGRVHRDLKSPNVLVKQINGKMLCKVADFGTATLLDKAMLSSTAVDVVPPRNQTYGVGTPLWMAPEILAAQPYDQSVDVYSYGIVMWELASLQEPWTDVSGPFLGSKLLALIRDEVRPPIQEGWPEVYVEIMRACWATQPSARISFAVAREELSKITSIED